jgi:5-methylcytosine-specific restriction protein A
MSDNWSKNELRDAIVAYKLMQSNPEVVKTHVYRELSKKYPWRTESAFERRMMNISHVLKLSGRDWLDGLKPLKHVGPNKVREIEEILAEVESREVNEDAIRDSVVKEALSKEKKIERPNGSLKPVRKSAKKMVYSRDVNVISWVLDNANGKCELCNSAAPFIDGGGIPFLEVHHVIHLADGGPDTVENAVALCPNCHRELHYGMKSKDKRGILYNTITRLK